MSKTKKNPSIRPTVEGDTVFLVKYALSSGVCKREVEKSRYSDKGWVELILPEGSWPRSTIVQRKHIALDEAERDEKVLGMIERKLASLAKQKAKLEKLRESYTPAGAEAKSP